MGAVGWQGGYTGAWGGPRWRHGHNNPRNRPGSEWGQGQLPECAHMSVSQTVHSAACTAECRQLSSLDLRQLSSSGGEGCLCRDVSSTDTPPQTVHSAACTADSSATRTADSSGARGRGDACADTYAHTADSSADWRAEGRLGTGMRGEKGAVVSWPVHH